MALYLLRAILENTVTGESSDRAVFGWHVTADVAPGALQVINAVAAAQNGAGGTNIIQANYAWDVAQVYDVFAKGPPIDESVFGGSAVPNVGASGPQEVQVCITRYCDDTLGRPEKIGRRYMGPIGGTWLDGNARVPQTLIDSVLAWELRLYDEFTLNSWVPVVSTGGAANIARPITGLGCDNAWDTQRRRGIDPTTSTDLDLAGAPLG